MNLKYYIKVLSLVGLLIGTVHAAIRPQLTRIVAYATDKETAVEIVNDSSETYMVQAWLEDLEGKDTDIPLVLVPSVMKLDGKKQGKFRLAVMTGEIPTDREQVYWLSLQEIPPKDRNVENRLVVAIRTRLKVFVRPEGFNSAAAIEAVKQLHWSLIKEDGKLWIQAKNSTPYYISFGELAVGPVGKKGARIEDKYQMVPAFGQARYAVPEGHRAENLSVTWSGMNDWGGAGETFIHEVGL